MQFAPVPNCESVGLTGVGRYPRPFSTLVVRKLGFYFA